ncbi:MAG: 50S ribosome-binding GTPase [Methanothrix sp.]|nr:50S ribosome-binding GTPase [Methanothrix sp.]
MYEHLPSVPTSEELLDKAFRRASRAKSDEEMVRTAGNILSDSLANIIRRFPSFEGLHPFYREMADVVVGIDPMRISLSRISWASRKIRQISRDFRAVEGRRAAFGRISSVMRSVKPDLEFLIEARERLRRIPAIDPSRPAIIIAGYPNVGKSSFIARVTGSRPRIASYPFTTRAIHVGHLERGGSVYQFLDTPGLLDRPASQRNAIERQTIAALSHLQGAVLFIIDPSGHCGYPLHSQLKLAEELEGSIGLPMLIVANKADILGHEGPAEMSTKTGQGVEEVLERLLAMLRTRTPA